MRQPYPVTAGWPVSPKARPRFVRDRSGPRFSERRVPPTRATAKTLFPLWRFSPLQERQQARFQKQKNSPAAFSPTPRLPLGPDTTGTTWGKESNGEEFNQPQEIRKDPGLAAGVFSNPFRLEPDNQ